MPGWYANSFSFKTTVANLHKADGLKHYVDWAAEHGLGIIDANVPKYLTGSDVCAVFLERKCASDTCCRRKMATRMTIQRDGLRLSID